MVENSKTETVSFDVAFTLKANVSHFQLTKFSLEDLKFVLYNGNPRDN